MLFAIRRVTDQRAFGIHLWCSRWLLLQVATTAEAVLLLNWPTAGTNFHGLPSGRTVRREGSKSAVIFLTGYSKEALLDALARHKEFTGQDYSSSNPALATTSVDGTAIKVDLGYDEKGNFVGDVFDGSGRNARALKALQIKFNSHWAPLRRAGRGGASLTQYEVGLLHDLLEYELIGTLDEKVVECMAKEAHLFALYSAKNGNRKENMVGQQRVHYGMQQERTKAARDAQRFVKRMLELLEQLNAPDFNAGSGQVVALELETAIKSVFAELRRPASEYFAIK